MRVQRNCEYLKSRDQADSAKNLKLPTLDIKIMLSEIWNTKVAIIVPVSWYWCNVYDLSEMPAVMLQISNVDSLHLQFLCLD